VGECGRGLRAEPTFRAWLCERRIPFVLATRNDDMLTSPDGHRRQAKVLAAIAGARDPDTGAAGWERRSIGAGAHGERVYDWTASSSTPSECQPGGGTGCWSDARPDPARARRCARLQSTHHRRKRGIRSQRLHADPPIGQRDPPTPCRPRAQPADLHRSRHALVEVAPSPAAPSPRLPLPPPRRTTTGLTHLKTPHHRWIAVPLPPAVVVMTTSVIAPVIPTSRPRHMPGAIRPQPSPSVGHRALPH
jgi:hypothetical protein